MIFEVHILGSSSATPVYQRHPTAQVLNIHDRLFLVDCGEGTLIQMNRFHIRFHKINQIFISHLHGDHYLGIMGLISTMHLQGRTSDLHLYSQPELKEIIDLQLTYSETTLRYNLIFHPVDSKTEALIYEDSEVEVHSIILSHRIPCTGFLFREKPRPRKLIKEKLVEYIVPMPAYNEIKKGKDFVTPDGSTIPNSELTLEPPPTRTYAFCSDTIYDETLIPRLQNVDMLYHEATFLHEDLERAKVTFHTTASQAATIALKSKVKRLLIGHFSARYKNLYPLLDEAKAVFENTTLAMEGDRFAIEMESE